MADPKYPDAAASDVWRKQVGELDTLKVGETLKKLESLFDALPLELFGTDGLRTAAQAEERLEQAITAGGKAAKALSDQARAVKAAADKLLALHRKNATAAKAVKHIEGAGAAAEALGKSIVALSASSAMAIKALAGKLAEDEKKAGEKDKVPAPLNPKLVAHNTKVRGVVAKLRGGTHPRTAFAFLQNKVRQPYNRAKPWEKKSILHAGPRALRSCRSELEKLLAPESSSSDFVFFFGEVEAAGPKGKVKLVFHFESPLANPKQMKDALLFQCKYSPPMQLRKQGSAQVIDEDAEGDEADAQAGDEPDDTTTTAVPTGGASAKENAAVDAARVGLVAAQTKLKSGIGSLMTHIGEAYRGVGGADLVAVTGALRKLDALRKKVDVDVAAALIAVTQAKDAKQRAKARLHAREKVKALGAVVTGDDLMADIDGNELMPGLVVVGPMKDSLKKVIGVLA